MSLHCTTPYTTAVLWPGVDAGKIFLKGYDSKLGKLNGKSEKSQFRMHSQSTSILFLPFWQLKSWPLKKYWTFHPTRIPSHLHILGGNKSILSVFSLLGYSSQTLPGCKEQQSLAHFRPIDFQYFKDIDLSSLTFNTINSTEGQTVGLFESKNQFYSFMITLEASVLFQG